MSHYGSGQRILDESKAESARDGIRKMAQLVQHALPAEREKLEAHAGRLAIELLAIEKRLAEV